MSELRVFYDCEFTDLAPDARLISIAFVCGSTKLYIVLTDSWTEGQCSYFVEERVLPLLGKHNPEKLDRDAAAVRIQAWLNALRDSDRSREIVMLSDSVWDWEMLKTLFWDLNPTPWARRENIAGRLVQQQFREIQSQLQAIAAVGFEDQHHALVDAARLQFAVQALLLGQPATSSIPALPKEAATLLAADPATFSFSEDDELLLAGRNSLLSDGEDWRN